MKKITSTVGTCALCQQTRQLEISHIIPKGCYSRLRNGASFTVNVVKRNAFGSQKQMQVRLLCRDCESLFDKNGERYFFQNCLQNDGSFSTFQRGVNHVAEVVPIGDQSSGYWPAAAIETSHEKVAYFAASLFWRTWAAKDKIPQDRISLDLSPELVEGLRDFLLGKTETVAHGALTVHLVGRLPAEMMDLRYTFSLPQEITRHAMGEGVRFYNSECLGFVFILLSAPEPMLTYARTNCILSNESHPIFVGPSIQQGSIARQQEWVRKSTPNEKLQSLYS